MQTGYGEQVIMMYNEYSPDLRTVLLTTTFVLVITIWCLYNDNLKFRVWVERVMEMFILIKSKRIIKESNV